MKNLLKKIAATFVALATMSASGLFDTTRAVLAYDAGIEAFVRSLYSDCLGRNPDPTGFNDWCSKLANRQITGKQCAYGFFYSPEFISKANNISDSELVETYYRVFLNRTSDAGGKQYWINKIANTNNDVSILFTGFADSVEFNTKCNSYGVTTGNHINVPNTNRTYNPSDDEYYLSLGYEIHYIDLGGGRTQKVYVQWVDCTDCMNQINNYRVANGVPACPIVTDPNDIRVQFNRTRAIEAAYKFSHGRPSDVGFTKITPAGYGGEDIYGGVANDFYCSAFEAWRSSYMHEINLRDTYAVSMTVASCSIIIADNGSPDGGYLTSTVLNWWEY